MRYLIRPDILSLFPKSIIFLNIYICNMQVDTHVCLHIFIIHIQLLTSGGRFGNYAFVKAIAIFHRSCDCIRGAFWMK